MTSSSSSRSVSFGDVSTRVFPMILGDNPACSSGAPVSIDWDHSDEFTLPLEEGDSSLSASNRGSSGSSSSGRRKAIPVTKRAQLLVQAGYSIEDIANAVILIEEIKQQRAESSQSTNLGDNIKVLLQNTGKLPMGIMKGVLKPLKKKESKLNSVQARSA